MINYEGPPPRPRHRKTEMHQQIREPKAVADNGWQQTVVWECRGYPRQRHSPVSKEFVTYYRHTKSAWRSEATYIVTEEKGWFGINHQVDIYFSRDGKRTALTS